MNSNSKLTADYNIIRNSALTWKLMELHIFVLCHRSTKIEQAHIGYSTMHMSKFFDPTAIFEGGTYRGPWTALPVTVLYKRDCQWLLMHLIPFFSVTPLSASHYRNASQPVVRRRFLWSPILCQGSSEHVACLFMSILIRLFSRLCKPTRMATTRRIYPMR